MKLNDRQIKFVELVFQGHPSIAMIAGRRSTKRSTRSSERSARMPSESAEGAKRQEKREKTVPRPYRETDVNHTNYPKALHKLALSWVSGNLEDKKKRPWLGIVGVSGKGKTRVLSQIVRNRIWNACRCEWVNATQFQWCAQNQHDHNDAQQRETSLHRRAIEARYMG